MAIDLKTETPDTTIDDSALLFGADSQSAASPSVYPVSALRDHIEASANVFTTAQTIQPLTDVAALTVRRSGSGATANILQVQDEGNNPLASINKDGRLSSINLRLGLADAAAPVAQTLSVQSVVAGTTNTAGADFTIDGSQGTGTGAGGSIVFRVAPAGSSGTAQNALATFLEATSARSFNLYNTTDVTTNFERGFARWSSDVFQIGTAKGGTGTARALELQTDGTTRFAINSTASAFDFFGAATSDVSIRAATFASFIVRIGAGAGSPRASLGAGFGVGVVGTETNHPFEIKSNNIPRLKINTIGSVEISTALTVATLPGTPVVGMIARVTDADSPSVGSTVVGAGAANALVWYNGSNWTVIGV
jgi:hypothetical protein